MRVPLILLALAIAACSNDRIVEPSTARATGLVLAPDSATIDTAGTLQVQSKLVWSDGAEHSASVTYTASGGTISTTGLFMAGTAAGRFLVIAACTCGLTDTTTVTVTDQSGPQTFASLAISASGLPVGIPAQLSVTGPDGYRRDVTIPVRLDSLKPGAYSLLASSTAVGPDLFAPTPSGQSITLAAADAKSAQVVFVRAGTPSTTLPPHPRVWMTPARLMQLRAQAGANTIRWQRVKAAADKQVLKGAVYAGGDEAYLGHLCLAYLGTGNQAYATRAGAILTAYAVDANDLTTSVGYNYRYLPSPTMGLDWCYAGLTPAQRHQTATWLMNRADQVWPETNPATTAYSVRDVQDNYYWGFMMTGPAALAAAGDDTLAGPVSGSNRPAYHQALALGKWNTVAVPYFNSAGAGGAWSEGIGYGTGDTQNAGKFADAFATAGQPLATTWFADAARWLMHVTMPGGLFKVPFGDQARVSMAPEFIYDRQAMFQIRDAASSDPALRAQAQTWLDWIGQVPVNELGAPAVLVDELLRYDPAQSAAPDLSALPKCGLAAGAGELVCRQSWTDPNATAFAFRSGAQSESHASLDANGLQIWKGGYWVTGDANIYSASGIQQLSDKFNTLTVGGRGQSHHDGPSLVSTVLSDTLVVVSGQAASGYLLPGNPTGNASNVSDYLRTVVYLPMQDVFVVVDRVTAPDATQAKVFRWHTKDTPQVSGNTFRLQNPAGDERCFGSVLLPADAVLGAQAFMLGSTLGQVTSNAVTVTLPTGRASDVVVTVLQCTNSFSASIVPTVATDAAAVEVTFGTKRVTVPLKGAQSVTVETPAILRNP